MSNSHSKLSLYQRCPARYRYEVIDQLQVPDQPKSDALAFGSALHQGIEGYLRGLDGLLMFDAYWDMVKSDNIAYSRYDWDTLKGLGHTLLERFSKRHLKHFKPILMEQRLIGTCGGEPVDGKPDFYGFYKGELAIVDFKSAAYRYQKVKTVMASQLLLYADLLRQNGHELPKKLVYIVFVKYPPKPSIQTLEEEITEDLLSLHLANTEKVIKTLKADKLYAKNTNSCIIGQSLCPWIDFCFTKVKKEAK